MSAGCQGKQRLALFHTLHCYTVPKLPAALHFSYFAIHLHSNCTATTLFHCCQLHTATLFHLVTVHCIGMHLHLFLASQVRSNILTCQISSEMLLFEIMKRVV